MLFSDLPPHLSEPIAAGKKYLVATSRQLWLTDDTVYLTPPPGSSGAARFTVADVELLWSRFSDVLGDRTEISESDLRRLTRLSQGLIDRVVRKAGITTVEGTYDPQAAFAAVVASVLHRQGVPFTVCLRAARFVFRGEGARCRTTSR